MKTSVEIVRRVFDDSEGVFVEIGESQDNPDWLEIRTTGAKSIEWFGKVNFAMPAEFMHVLGAMLMNSASEKMSGSGK